MKKSNPSPLLEDLYKKYNLVTDEEKAEFDEGYRDGVAYIHKMQREKTHKAGQANAQKYFAYYETLRAVVSDIRQGNLITSKKEKITTYRIMKELNARGIETAEKHIYGLEKDVLWKGTSVAKLVHYLDTGESLNAAKRQEKRKALDKSPD